MSRPRPPVPAPAALLTNVSVLEPVSRVTFWSLCVLVVRSAHPRGTAGTRRCLVSRVPADCPRHQLLLGMAAVCRFVCGAARRRSLSQLVVWTCASLCLCGGSGEPSGVPMWVHADVPSCLGCCLAQPRVLASLPEPGCPQACGASSQCSWSQAAGDPCPVWARAWQAAEEQDLQHLNQELRGLLEPDPGWDLSKGVLRRTGKVSALSEPHWLSSAGR